ncbi:hypothetical protein KKH39_03570 [Patescibacteria group bacterium]|nr:hypothetical protein [Patescibacteria group bacterium]
MPYEFKWPIYGHKNQLKFLQQAILQDKLPNTYLFYGPAGLGKKMVVDYFVKSYYCLDTKAKPCDKCDHCRMINKGTFLNVYKLGDREDLSIENIREFLYKLSLSNFEGNHKIAIIYGTETINLFGANALLKTLEEPPTNTTIIMIADSIVDLPATVISRAQLLKFQSLSRVDMQEWLASYDYSREEKDTIINLSFGKPGVALRLMGDNLASFKKNCNFIIKLLSADTFSYMQAIDRWFEILKKEYPGYKVYELGKLTSQYLDLLEIFLRDILWIKIDKSIANEIYRTDLEKIAKNFDLKKLLNNLLSLNSVKQKIKHNVSPQLLWENLFLSIK